MCTFFDYGNHRGGTDATVSVQPWHTNFKAQLDLSSLDRDVQFYFERGLAPSTHRTYWAGINRFVKFCTAHHVQAPLPVSQSLLCYYITFLAKSGLAYGTIKTYISAVRHLHVANDLLDPTAVPMPKMKMVANGIRKVQATSSHQKPCLPITPTILNQIRAL